MADPFNASFDYSTVGDQNNNFLDDNEDEFTQTFTAEYQQYCSDRDRLTAMLFRIQQEPFTPNNTLTSLQTRFPDASSQQGAAAYGFGQPQEAQPTTAITQSHGDSLQIANPLDPQQYTSPFSSRQIVNTPPFPAAPNQHRPVPLARTPSTDDRKPPVPMGPMSNPVSVPARPKPGRKPMPPDKASDRRRLQNRIAQRNFRDKRQQKVCELNDEINEVKQVLRDAEAEHQRQLQAQRQEMRHEIRRLENDLQETQRELQDARQQLQDANSRLEQAERSSHNIKVPRLPSISTQPPSSIRAAIPPITEHGAASPTGQLTFPTPPADSYQEIDMTEAWQRQKTGSSNQQYDTGNFMSYTMDTDPTSESRCGFCTDDGNCACKAAPAPTPSVAQNTAGPGNCDLCQKDPARAEACRSIANRVRPSPVIGDIETSSRKMNCGQLLDRFDKDLDRVPSIAELFGPLHAFPAASGFNVDEQEAAQVLQGMSKRTPAPHAR